MEVSFEVKLRPEDLYRFNMYQTYTGMQGILSIVIAAVVFVMAAITGHSGSISYMFLYIFIGMMVLFYIPVTLWTRAKHTIRTNEVLANPLRFTLTDKAICVTQADQSGELPWDQIYKMISNRKQVLIYSNRINAYIIPRDQIEAQYQQIAEITKAKLPSYRIRMKG